MTKSLLFFWDFGRMLGHAYYALNIQGLLYGKSFKLSEVLLEGLRGHHSYFQDSATLLISNRSLSVFGSCNQCSVGICYFRRGHVLSQGGNCVTQQNYWWLSHSIILIEVVPTGTTSSPLIRIHPTRDVVCLSNISDKCFFLLYVVFNMQDVIFKDYPFLLWIEKTVTLCRWVVLKTRYFGATAVTEFFLQNLKEEALNKSDIIWWEST